MRTLPGLSGKAKATKFGKVEPEIFLRFQDTKRLTRIRQNKFLIKPNNKGEGPVAPTYKMGLNNRYYAVFSKEASGYSVRFPDVEGAITEGSSVDDALEMAVDALSAILAVGRKGRDYKKPSSFSEIAKIASKGDLVLPVLPDAKVMEEYKPKKRINIMIDATLLADVDRVVKRKKIDRSKWLADSARMRLKGVFQA